MELPTNSPYFEAVMDLAQEAFTLNDKALAYRIHEIQRPGDLKSLARYLRAWLESGVVFSSPETEHRWGVMLETVDALVEGLEEA